MTTLNESDREAEAVVRGLSGTFVVGDRVSLKPDSFERSLLLSFAGAVIDVWPASSDWPIGAVIVRFDDPEDRDAAILSRDLEHE